MTKASKAWKSGEFRDVGVKEAGGGILEFTIITHDGKTGTFKVKNPCTKDEKILSDSELK